MATLFSSPDTGKQEARIAAQEKKVAMQEKAQAGELSARRRAASGGSKSKTLFSAVEGMGTAATAKKTTLGGK